MKNKYYKFTVEIVTKSTDIGNGESIAKNIEEAINEGLVFQLVKVTEDNDD